MDVIAVTIPIQIVTFRPQNVFNIAADNATTLMSTIPESKVSESDDAALYLNIQISPFVIQAIITFIVICLVVDGDTLFLFVQITL